MPQRIIKGLEISKETLVDEIAEKIYNYWKSQTFINFVKNVTYTMRPILLDVGGFPNKKYKDFLSYFAFNYRNYPKAFITALFFSALEQNAITGVIRIVANDHNFKLVQPESKEMVFEDSKLLYKLKDLDSIIPLIMSDGKRVSGTYAKNAVISNTIIVSLSNTRPDNKRQRNNNNNLNSSKKQKIGYGGGTRKRRRKLKATRRIHRCKYRN